MNNLNKSSQKGSAPVPDILRNLNGKEDDKDFNKDIHDDVTEKKPLNVPSSPSSEDQPEQGHEESQRRKSRKLKKVLGYTGWVLCFPLMLTAIAIRDKPSKEDADEWKDDPCLPWWYDVNFKYPGEDDKDSS